MKMKKKIKMSMKKGVAAIYKDCHVGLAILYKVAYSHVNRLTARQRVESIEGIGSVGGVEGQNLSKASAARRIH